MNIARRVYSGSKALTLSGSALIVISIIFAFSHIMPQRHEQASFAADDKIPANFMAPIESQQTDVVVKSADAATTTERPPKYSGHFRSQNIPVEKSGGSACTEKDKPFRRLPSRGCKRSQEGEQMRSIMFMCDHPPEVTCSLPLPKARKRFFNFLSRTSVYCERVVTIGELDARLCMSPGYELKKDKCLVYGFGIGDDWSFDDGMSQKYGCEVHSFDPTIHLEDHKRDDRISFHNMGLSCGQGEKRLEKNLSKWKMESLTNIVKMLGHEKATIDVLKIDVEFAEWDCFEDAIKSGVLNNVKQLMAEFHVWTDHTRAYVRFYRILAALENAGFEKYHTYGKPVSFSVFDPEAKDWESVVFQINTGYINTRFLPRQVSRYGQK